MTRINDNGLDREMTAAEQAAYETWAAIAQAEHEVEQQTTAVAAAARVSALTKLKALGLTDAEVAALVSG